jgi:hypothetical protein
MIKWQDIRELPVSAYLHQGVKEKQQGFPVPG